MKARIPGTDRSAMIARIQKAQQDMEAVQQDVRESTFVATSGSGLVEAEVSGDHTLRSIKISPDAVDPQDVEMLEDLILSAVNEASRKATETMEQRVAEIQAQIQIPGMPG
jgi:DNA-binding YbaB/EbfC family protein